MMTEVCSTRAHRPMIAKKCGNFIVTREWRSHAVHCDQQMSHCKQVDGLESDFHSRYILGLAPSGLILSTPTVGRVPEVGKFGTSMCA